MNSQNRAPGNRKERRTHKALIRRAMEKAGVKYQVDPHKIAPQSMPSEVSETLKEETKTDA